MGVMSNKLTFKSETNVRTERLVYKNFKKQIAGLDAKFDGREPTIEAVMSALFFWFGNLPQEQAEALMAEQLAQLEDYMRALPEYGNDADEPKEPTERKIAR